MVDAIGNQVVKGKKYGYSQSGNGHQNIVVGIADNIMEKKTTLIVSKEVCYSYGEFYKTYVPDKVEKRTVHSCMLFPVLEN
jgi:hypothetical protein